MKCHILFSEKNKKNISKCRLLKILPRVLSVKTVSSKKPPDEVWVGGWVNRGGGGGGVIHFTGYSKY